MTAETQLTETDISDLNAIGDLLQKGISNIQKACEMLVAKLDAGITIAEIHDVTRIPVLLIGNMERIGRKQMVASLLYDASAAGLKLQRLPYSEQKRLVEGAPGWPDLAFSMASIASTRMALARSL